MMKIEADNAKRPLVKLRKTLKRLEANPSAEHVHALRTQTRRIEAIVNALMLEHKKRTRQLLKTVTPVRRAAGDVRDVDVLVGNLLALPHEQEDDESLVRLVDHLSEMRAEGARGLQKTVAELKKEARRGLKDYSKLVDKQFEGKKRAKTSGDSAPKALASELAAWPRLNPENIHDFRIKVKQFRYMLQLSREADRKLVDALGKVKDEVGDWHDWQELSRIAQQVLNSKTDGAALKRIDAIGKNKYKQALTTANAVREGYLGKKTKGAKKKAAKGGAKRSSS
jgi:CHAD domain-containing protein